MSVASVAQSTMHEEEAPDVLKFSDSVIRHSRSLVALEAENTDSHSCLADGWDVVGAVANCHYSATLSDVLPYQLHQVTFLTRTHPAKNLRATQRMSHCRHKLRGRRFVIKQSVQNVTLNDSTELALAGNTTELIKRRPASNRGLVLRPKSCDVITGLSTQDAKLRIVRDKAATLPDGNGSLELVTGDHTHLDLCIPHGCEGSLHPRLQLVLHRCDSDKMQLTLHPCVELFGQSLSVAQFSSRDSLYFSFKALPFLSGHLSVRHHQYPEPSLSERLSLGQQLFDHSLVLILRTPRQDKGVRSFHVHSNRPDWSTVSKTASLYNH
mmetsp:Transcript_59336/g.158894  ORF Transcript_59336/g.158894 Transcript_59336/m.158894 type:complete len:324 (-) Transcript_59336:1254-2225(-)